MTHDIYTGPLEKICEHLCSKIGKECKNKLYNDDKLEYPTYCKRHQITGYCKEQKQLGNKVCRFSVNGRCKNIVSNGWKYSACEECYNKHKNVSTNSINLLN